MNYYRCIDRTKIQFDFLYFVDIPNNYYDEIVRLGGKCYKIGKPGISLSYFFSIIRLFRSNRGVYTALHCHPIFTPVVYGIIARCYGIRNIIVHSHSTCFSDKMLSAIRNRLLAYITGMIATHYVACTPEASMLIRHGIATNKDIHIWRNDIDCRKYIFNVNHRDKLRQELNVSSDEIIVGTVGRLSPEKNHEYLLKLFYHCCDNNTKMKLVIVGDGPLRDELVRKICQYNLEHCVCLLGKRNDIPELLSAFDVFVLPSLFEGAPVSVIEAQASGLPCIVSDTITRCVDAGTCSYLSLEAPYCIWHEKICSVLLESGDRELRNKDVIEAGFDISKQTPEIERFYLELR